VNRAAHTLKSNSRSIGATTLAELCLGLQEATSPATTEAADLATPEITHRVAAIAAELNRVMSELDSLVPPNAG
jgi:HPt (histidine-containing phosphotransfer) domain-containing protein